MFSDIQLREIFHLCFLERLLKLSGPDQYVLKGGVNLRFFCNSPRYSEDMDLDVTAGSAATLKKNGYKILEDKGFVRSLRSYGINGLEVNDPQKAKQTDTTQRFRVGLLNQSGLRLPTKVEFSRRGDGTGATTDPIDPEVARQYRKLPFRCRHYPPTVAAAQKIQALAGRPSVQARDLFDLHLLHAHGYINTEELKAKIPANTREKARAAAITLTLADFQGQVIEFLDHQNQALYNTAPKWAEIQTAVLRLLDDA